MKGKQFEIKISDLLHHLGSDHLTLENEPFERISKITDAGISCEIELFSMNEESILVKIRDLQTVMKETCDVCQKEFLREVKVPEYSAKFTLNKEEFQYSEEEVVFMIDEKKETINIEDMIYQAIELETPFVIKCEECAKLPIEDEDEEE